jgi:hypothetical protein
MPELRPIALPSLNDDPPSTMGSATDITPVLRTPGVPKPAPLPPSVPSVPSTPAHTVAAPALRIDALNAPPSSSATGVFSPPTPTSVAPVPPPTKEAQSTYQMVVGAAPKAAAPIMPPAPPPAPIIPAKSGATGGPLKVDPTTGEPKARLVPLLLALLLVTVVTVGVVMLVLAPWASAPRQ